MTTCPTCSAELEPEREHYCAKTRESKVTREEFDALRGAVTSLMTSISTPIRDAAFARGATDALVTRVETLESVTNAIWTCADEETKRIDALARFVGFEEQENTGAAAWTVTRNASGSSQTCDLGDGNQGAREPTHHIAVEQASGGANSAGSPSASDRPVTTTTLSQAGSTPASTHPQFFAAYDALKCLIGTSADVLADLAKSRSFTTRTVSEMLRRAIDTGGGGHGAGVAPGIRGFATTRPAASALPPLPPRPACILSRYPEVTHATGRDGQIEHRNRTLNEVRDYAQALESHLAAAKAELAKMPCGHPQTMSDSYGGCWTCLEQSDLRETIEMLRSAISAMTDRAQRAEKRAEGMVTKEVAIRAGRCWTNCAYGAGYDRHAGYADCLSAAQAEIEKKETKDGKA